MSLSFILVAFSVAVITGAIAVTTFARMCPGWSARRQGLVAASILPAIALLATLAGIVNLYARGSVNADMRDLALATIVTGGLISAAIGFVGGLLGVFLRQRGRK